MLHVDVRVNHVFREPRGSLKIRGEQQGQLLVHGGLHAVPIDAVGSPHVAGVWSHRGGCADTHPPAGCNTHLPGPQTNNLKNRPSDLPPEGLLDPTWVCVCVRSSAPKS